jgi:hypothetical protein
MRAPGFPAAYQTCRLANDDRNPPEIVKHNEADQAYYLHSSHRSGAKRATMRERTL